MMVGSREIKNAKIGVGSMGRPIIAKLLEKEFEVKLTINIPKLRVMAQGTLTNHVREKMMVQTGALAGMDPGQTWIDISTLDYRNTEHIAELAAQKRIDSLEALVSNLWQMGSVGDDETNASLGVGFVCKQVWTCLTAVKMGRISLVAQKPGFL